LAEAGWYAFNLTDPKENFNFFLPRLKNIKTKAQQTQTMKVKRNIDNGLQKQTDRRPASNSR
jgi:hypothetical protein